MKTTFAYDYTALQKQNLKDVGVVIWTHPDIPFYASEIIKDKEGGYTTGGSLSKQQVIDWVAKQ